MPNKPYENHTPKQQVRYVTIRDVVYLRMEDVQAMIREIASTEETDVRNRLNALADNLKSW